MGRPKQAGPREPSGRLQRNLPDAGAEMVRAHRAGEVGTELAHDPRATWAFGRLAVTGALCDPGVDRGSDRGEEQTEARYRAGERYAEEHLTIFGTGSVGSVLRSLTRAGALAPDGRDDTRLEAVTMRHKQKYRDAMTTPAAGRLLGHQVLALAVLYDTPIDDPRDQQTLRSVLDRIGGAKRREHFHQDHPEMAGISVGSGGAIVKSAGDCADESILPAPLRRRGRGLDILFVPGERSLEEKAAIAAAAAKLRPHPPTV